MKGRRSFRERVACCGRRIALWSCALAAIGAASALCAAPAGAQVHQALGVFCEPSGIGTPPCEPSFTAAQEMAVVPAGLTGAGDLLVIDAGAQTVRRFKPNGEPDPFAALGTNTIDGKGAGGCAFPPTPSAECDQTPQNGLAFGSPENTQIAVAPASAGATAGDIYLTYRTFSPELFLVDIFSEAGKYLGQLSESSAGPFSRACGVAVDHAGAVYVGDLAQGIHKFTPAANPAVNADNSANFAEATTTVSGPCGLAAGTQPLASGGSEGFLFATNFNGKVVKLDAATGAFQYTIVEGENVTVSVDEASGHPFVALNKGFVSEGEVREYDASGALEAGETSHIATGPAAPVEGNVYGLAVSPLDGKVYLATFSSTHVGVWGPAEAQPPTIEGQAALEVGTQEASVEAMIGAEGAPTTYHAEYIDEASYEAEGGFAGPNLMQTAEKPAGEANLPVNITETLGGLKEGTVYRWRFVATNACAPAEGTCGTTEGEAGKEDPRLRTPVEHPFELLDGRVWEMASPSEKENAELATDSTPGILHTFSVKPQQSSADGEAVTYASFTSFGKEAEGAPATVQFISRRGPGGWSTQNINPIFEEAYLRDPFVGVSTDLSKAAVIAFNPPLAPGAPAGFWNLYSRDVVGGGYEALSTSEPQLGEAAPCLAFAGASESFDRVFFAAKSEALLAGNPVPGGAGSANLYEWSAAARDDVQALTVKATSGTYTLAFGSGGPGVSETAEIAAGAGAGAVQTALNGLENIFAGGGSVTVTGGPGNAAGTSPYLISFDGGPLPGTPQPALIATDVSLAGGSSSATLATLASGHLALVSTLPSGAPATPAANTSFGAAHSFTAASGCDMEKVPLQGAVSADGRRSFWTLDGSFGSPAATSPLLGRFTDPLSGESKTFELDAKQGGSGLSGFGEYRGAARDGRFAFFTDEQKLVGGNSNPGDLYRYDVQKREAGEPAPLQDLTAHTGEAAGVLGVLGVSEKGDYAYFAATGKLTTTPNPATGKSAEAGKPNLYAWHEGEAEPRFIATVAPGPGDAFDWNTDPSEQTARVSPDGLHLAFLSTAPLSGYDNTDQKTGKRDSEVFLFDFESGELSCASCNPTGARPIGPSGVPTWTTPYEQPRYLSDDGGRLYFETQDALDPFYDTNGAAGCPAGDAGGPACEDVYEFERAGHGDCATTSPTYSPFSGGCVELLSSGQSTDKSYLIDASADGRDVFLSTRQKLVPQLDTDEAFDVYDARVGGSPPPTPPQACEGEGCPSQGTGASPSAAAGSAHLFAPGNPPPKRAACPKGKRRVRHDGKARCVARHPKHHKRAPRRSRRAGR